MPKYVFTGVAFVTGVQMIVKAPTLGEAIGILAREEACEIDLDKVDVQYSWADFNSGKEMEEGDGASG